MEIYYSEPKIKDALDAAAHTDHFKGKIEFREVSFQYEDGELPVLHDISFYRKTGGDHCNHGRNRLRKDFP